MFTLLLDYPELMIAAFGVSVMILIPWHDIGEALRMRRQKNSGRP